MGKSAASKQLDQANKDKKNFLGKIDSFEYTSAAEKGIENPFADVKNANAGLTNQFANQRVATGASEFQQQANDQSTANILDSVVQGGGGAATSATALARQAQLGNQQIAAGLQGQEQQIGLQSAQGQAQVDQLKAAGEGRRQELVAGGKQYIQGLSEARDVGELEGLGNLYAGANESANSALAAKAATTGAIIGAVGSIVGAVAGGGVGSIGSSIAKKIGSDPRLKKNIARIGTSDSGIPIYQFDYKDREGRFQGAMSTEVPKEAVIPNFIGEYDGVDYSMIDVTFKEI